MLTGFQLRTGKVITDINSKELAGLIGITYSTIIRLDRTPNLAFLKCHLRTSLLIRNLFEKEGVVFPNNNSVSLNPIVQKTKELPSGKLSIFQLKASRIATSLTQKTLGRYIGIPQTTLSDIEIMKEKFDCLPLSDTKAQEIKEFFVKKGIIFPDASTIELVEDPASVSKREKSN
jgi:DNA-binding XRE family transcriptional regulator